MGENLHEFRSFGTIWKYFHWVQRRAIVVDNRCAIILDNSDSVGIMDVASLSLAREYFFQQQFPQLPCRHGSINQRSLELNLIHHFLPRIILDVATCHTHTLSFPTISESFNREIRLTAIRESFHPWNFPFIRYARGVACWPRGNSIVKQWHQSKELI